jgi:CRISPR-associated exonuclease Cas4/CRISPR-associated protein Cas1
MVPVRMVNEWVYCPRLAFVEWVDGEWAGSGDTGEGAYTCASVPAAVCWRRRTRRTPDFTARSVTPALEALGITAKIDLIEA